MKKHKILVFASGTSSSGGTGFENLVNASRVGLLNADIIGVVSNHLAGGVHEKAKRLQIPFFLLKECTNEGYQNILRGSGADLFVLCGWLKQVSGIDSKTPFNSTRILNIHPGPLPDFGGFGFYGRRVHEGVWAAFRAGMVDSSAVTIHFVTENYDDGPTVHIEKVPIYATDTVELLEQRVRQCEYEIYPKIINQVLDGIQ